MPAYTDEYSRLSSGVIYEPVGYKDVDDSIATLVNEIKALQAQGQYDQAAIKIAQNRDVLRKYVINAEAINRIEEETRNIEVLFKTKTQSIKYQSEEPTENIMTGDVWIG